MSVFPYTGPSYTYRERVFDAQRSVNQYRVKSETGDSKATYAMQGSPGRTLFSNLGNDGIRGCREFNGRCFFVMGSTLYELDSLGVKTNRGTITTSQYGAVGISDNGLQLIIVDGATTGGYILTLATNSFAQITDPYFLGADTVCFIDGYFIFNKPDSDIYYLSALYDGSTGDPLMFNTASNATDNLVAVHETHNQLWLLGAASIQIQYDSGGTFPFSNISGAYIRYGCAAAFSVQSVANTIFWVGSDDQGNGVVWMANGYQPQRISTHAVEFAIQGYGDISQAVAFTYQEDGNYFYIVNFPGADTSWCFDIGLQEWHERAFFNSSSGAYERDKPQFHVFCFGKHLVGDYFNGNVYEQDLDIYDHDGVEIRRMRSAPHLYDDLEYIYHNKFQLDMRVGVGASSGADQDTNPQIALQWSDDGGYTWSNEHWRPVGKVGAYLTRVIWRILGRSRDRIYRTIYTAKTPFFVIAAHLDVEKGTN